VSIWSSVNPLVEALNGDSGAAANYRAEGKPTITIDVATARSFHDHIRLALWDEAGIDVCALLSPDDARALRDCLAEALKVVEP
jgi:hypothetical protein